MRGTARVTGVVLMAAMLWGCGASDGAPTSDPPACESIETFAERVGVVIRGELTGEVVDQSASSDLDDAYIGYKISVDEVLAGEAPDGSVSVIISVAYNANLLDADPFAEAATPGVPVIVFAYATPNAPGGLSAAVMEGFMTAREGEAPIGWVGQLGEWSSMTSLDDVAAAVTSGTE